MPDFHLPERIVTLAFEDGDLKGLELRVRLSLPFDTLFETQTRLAKAESAEDLRDLLHFFAEHALVGWNLSNGSGPVQLTPVTFTAHVDGPNAVRMLTRYLSEVGRVPAPLAPRSRSGSTSKGRRGSRSPKS